MHAVVLAIVLVGLLAVVGPRVAFFSDEGAAIIQARQLATTGSWVEPNPFPVIDPQGQARTIPNADVGMLGRAPYAKHPLYPWLLQGAERWLSPLGFLLLSVAGTVAAAVIAGLLADLIAVGTGRWALWVVGLASPLFFDSYLVLGHTLAAAGAALATWAALRSLPSSRGFFGWLFLVGLGLAAGVALRSEGVLFGIALAVVMLAVACRPRPGWSRWTAVGVAGVAVGTVGAVRVVERQLLIRHIGHAAANGTPDTTTPVQGAVARVAHGFGQTVLSPGYQLHATGTILVGLAAVLVLSAGVVSRGRRPELVVVLLASAATLLVGRVVMGAPSAIPGLLVAFPLALFALGLALGRRGAIGSAEGSLALGVLVLFAAAVVATQYAKGGGVEWGGRYFALGMPLGGALIVVVLDRHLGGRGRQARVLVVALLGLASLASAALAVTTLRHGHQLTANLEHVLVEAGASVRRAGSGAPHESPVALTSEQFVPQIEWPQYASLSWLAPDAPRLGEFSTRLHRTGVRHLIVVTVDPAASLAAMRPDYLLERRMPVPGVPGLAVLLVRASP